MTLQNNIGWATASTGVVLLLASLVLWLIGHFDVDYLNAISGVVSFLLLISGIALSLGGLWVVSLRSPLK